MSAASEPTASLQVALAHAGRLLASAPALAAQQAQEILRTVPGQPRALLLLGAAHNARGAVEQAIAVLAPLAEQQPRWAAAQLELGIALGRIGRGNEALAALRRAVALDPTLPRAWLALADHLSATGDDAGAKQAYANHVRHSTHDPVLMRAGAALADNCIPEAEALLRAHLKRAPTDIVAIRMLAEVAARLGRNDDAEALLARCVELAPGFEPARQQYAMMLHRNNKPSEALAEVEALLEADPHNPGNRNLKAVVLCRLGDYATALALYDGILAAYPGQAKIWMSYGHALKTAGRQDEAVAAYRRSIALEPGFGEAYWSLANLKTVRFDDADLAAMRAQLARTDLAVEDRFHFEFALGKALEDAGDYAASFAHYAAGNAQRRGTVHYSADETASRVDRTCRVFTREFFA
ncbi:MAG: tetratricopeptide repeat protein, partial [Luteimonas sp.]